MDTDKRSADWGGGTLTNDVRACREKRGTPAVHPCASVFIRG